MILRLAAIVLLLCSIGFCQEQKASTAPAPQAKVVFYRATGVAGNMLHASIKIDGDEPTHKIENSHMWKTELPAGSHFIFSDDKRYGRDYVLEAGRTYYFRVVPIMSSNSVMNGRVRFRVLKVADDVADAETWGLEEEK
jgi:hypothetical protein